MRILDLDFDFFLYGTVHDIDPGRGERLDPDKYPSWDRGEAIKFLEQQCLLTESCQVWPSSTTVRSSGFGASRWPVARWCHRSR